MIIVYTFSSENIFVQGVKSRKILVTFLNVLFPHKFDYIVMWNLLNKNETHTI